MADYRASLYKVVNPLIPGEMDLFSGSSMKLLPFSVLSNGLQPGLCVPSRGKGISDRVSQEKENAEADI
jgi:hypothetical protein